MKKLLFVLLLLPLIVKAADPKYAGDVVGRDLSYTGLGSLGHVGIYTGSSVLEVLNSASPIQKNSLTSFKNASPNKFWGARYVVGTNKSYYFQAVIDKGWDQSNYNPTYTISPIYTIGSKSTTQVYNSKTRRWETRTTITPAKFRCDSFVYYAFDAGIRYKLAGAGNMLPRTVFNNCPMAR